MRNDLLEFLFGSKAQPKDEELGLKMVQIFEEAGKLEAEQLAVSKKPLSAALKAVGISQEVLDDHGTPYLGFEDDCECAEVLKKLRDPDAMHILAQKGWVSTYSGDINPATEVPWHKINFIEITTADTGKEDKPDETIEQITKKSRKEATTQADRDDKSNPVENPDASMGGNQEGIGKVTSGKDPEGKPKGYGKTDENLNEGKHKSGCTCGFCKNKGKFGKKTAKQIADNLLETTTTSGVPCPIVAPMGVIGQGLAKRRRYLMLRKQKRHSQ
jgi:hypothetical protein